MCGNPRHLSRLGQTTVEESYLEELLSQPVCSIAVTEYM
jgi:hypothetical protein